jgi:hypothetical protein
MDPKPTQTPVAETKDTAAEAEKKESSAFPTQVAPIVTPLVAEKNVTGAITAEDILTMRTDFVSDPKNILAMNVSVGVVGLVGFY